LNAAEFSPDMNSTQPPENTPATQQPSKSDVSTIAGWFAAFAVISFIAIGLAIYRLSTDNRIDNQQGAMLLPVAISGAFFCLAVAKIIQCLHVSSQRLQRIEKLLEPR